MMQDPTEPLEPTGRKWSKELAKMAPQGKDNLSVPRHTSSAMVEGENQPYNFPFYTCVLPPEKAGK